MIAALGFHDEEAKQPMRNRAAEGSSAFAWKRVVYKRRDQHTAALEALRGIESAATAQVENRKIAKHELAAMLDAADLVPWIKESAFKDEAETRIVCKPGIHVDLMYLKHRPGTYGMIPYVELGLPKDPTQEFGDGPEPMNALPIIGAIVGPTRYPELARAGVLDLLRSHGHETGRVFASGIPFRP